MPRKDIYAEFEKKYREVVGKEPDNKDDLRMLLISIARAESTIETRKKELVNFLTTYEGLDAEKATELAEYVAKLLS
ncbi:MAG: hypothetical protein DRJ66_00405 [Thermoprotei archaeon]|nr:MAG: hypothetical protein DRJ66_00405 [Thermoprotei archaeon]RLF20412.1 MAG: hypothetical protein DRZ82_02515 [Thermoprotei archaeon]